ncbi:MAG: hypothetical protein P8X96_23305 [Desulfobacteraceae bacterium]
MRLKARWMGLFEPFAANCNLESGLDELVGRYAESHRHYHNLDHISGCLDAFDRIAGRLADPFAIETAIWFHDVVYDPKSGKNEERSAAYANAFLASAGVDPANISEIGRLIRLTRHPSNPVTDDEKYLIDIDLSTLGAEREQYDRYEEMIRKEYAYVPNLLYKKGRRELLKAFLNCKPIYRTLYFRERLEVQARSNIERALKKL